MTVVHRKASGPTKEVRHALLEMIHMLNSYIICRGELPQSKARAELHRAFCPVSNVIFRCTQMLDFEFLIGCGCNVYCMVKKAATPVHDVLACLWKPIQQSSIHTLGHGTHNLDNDILADKFVVLAREELVNQLLEDVDKTLVAV